MHGVGVHAAKRFPRFSYIGTHEYSITCCTFSRRRYFTMNQVVDVVRTKLLHIAGVSRFEIPAYCFMPDHVHFVAAGTSVDSNLRRFVHAWKQQTGYAHRQSTSSQLWQGGFYDHVLRDEEDRPAVIRYLLENPIRAGLVADLRCYPHWGSGLCSREGLLEILYDEETPVRGG